MRLFSDSAYHRCFEDKIKRAATTDSDVIITEVGGTVGILKSSIRGT